MRLSISNSNERLPTGNWLAVWLGIIVVIFSAIAFFEWHIRSLGWSPSTVDSVQLWSEKRRHASTLGDKAIILVGASRIQLDMDLNVIEKHTGLKPVQLAIDGTTYIPVLEDLADDPRVTGAVLISVNAYNMNKGNYGDVSAQWVNYYHKVRSQTIAPYQTIHDKIASFLDHLLVLRIEGAKPYTVISSLAFKKPGKGNYLVANPDRSRDADYNKVAMPMFYAARLQRHFGKPLNEKFTSYKEFFAAYRREISAIEPLNNETFLANLNYLLKLVNKIESRGGKVIIVRFPTGKLVWEVDNKKYPKNLFWDEIEKRHPASINFSDYASLNKFILPDGSHLDYRDKVAFTQGLMDIIYSKGFL